MKIYTFSYKEDFPLPPPQFSVDCRVIPNPHGKAGTTEGRKAVARSDPQFNPLVERAITILNQAGWVAIGCLYGKDRSGAVAEEVNKRTGILVSRWIERSERV